MQAQAKDAPPKPPANSWAAKASAAAASSPTLVSKVTPAVPKAGAAASSVKPAAVPQQQRASAGSSSSSSSQPKKADAAQSSSVASAAAVAVADSSGVMSAEMSDWCTAQLRKISPEGADDMRPLLDMLYSVKDASEVRAYFANYLGSTPTVGAFAAEYIKRQHGWRPPPVMVTPASAAGAEKKRGRKNQEF